MPDVYRLIYEQITANLNMLSRLTLDDDEIFIKYPCSGIIDIIELLILGILARADVPQNSKARVIEYLQLLRHQFALVTIPLHWENGRKRMEKVKNTIVEFERKLES